MERRDAVIVGGGPAGSSCAGALAAAGLDVLVIDRARFPRDKTCAGWITPAVVEALDLPVDDYRQRHVCQPITGFRTSRMGSAPVETRFGATVSYGICRLEFDHYLLERSGARRLEGTPVTRLERRGGGWVINGRIETPMLVGAGGHLCPVARGLGARPGDEPAIVAQEVELRLTPMQAAQCRVDPEMPDLQLCRDLRGYGWCFRKGDRLNIGLGRQDPAELPSHVRAFAEALVSSGTIPPGLAMRWKGHAYLLRDASTRTAVDDGVLLAGDAAGLACAVSGEGIRPAIESGLLAAATILAARGRYTRDALQSYADGLEARFPRSRRSPLSSWSRGLAAAVAGPLLSTPWFSRHVLLERWFLQAA